MKPCEKVIYKGKTVVVVDISYSKPDEAIAYLNEAHKIIAQLPPKSALILTDASEAIFNGASQKAINQFATQNTPFVRASATVGSVVYALLCFRLLSG
jgi:hypothetical protein